MIASRVTRLRPLAQLDAGSSRPDSSGLYRQLTGLSEWAASARMDHDPARIYQYRLWQAGKTSGK